MNTASLIWVSVFGLAGVLSRFAIDVSVSRWALAFPYGTLLINIAGCFTAGLIVGIGGGKNPPDHPQRLGLIVGFCGGFTTYSGFGLQVVQLAGNDRWAAALSYAALTPVLCILATAAGAFAARSIS